MDELSTLIQCARCERCFVPADLPICAVSETSKQPTANDTSIPELEPVAAIPSPWSRPIVLLPIIALVLCAGVGATLLFAMRSGPTTPDVKISADVLWSEYEKDRTAANSRYEGKMLEVQGVTGTVEADELGRFFFGAIRVRPVKPKHRAPGFEPIGDAWNRIQAAANLGEEPAIRLYFDDKDLSLFDRLAGKRPFTVRGRCKGTRFDPNAAPEYFVALEDCVFVAQSEDVRPAGKADRPKGRQADPQPQHGPGPPTS
jgi:hypothetical protein